MIKIFGKDYITVAERVKLANEHNPKLTITTEFLPVEGMVVCRATVITERGTFTGTSVANPTKTIEKSSPYEVAETSAVGRALGFAGYGIVDGIATADEMAKATDTPNLAPQSPVTTTNPTKCIGCPPNKPHATKCPLNRQATEGFPND